MGQIRPSIVALLISAGAAQGLAQAPVPIEPLLHNNDPRLVALGAWEVQKRGDLSYLAMLAEMVERWDPAQRHDSITQEQYDSMTVILDVIIQSNQEVSLSGVMAIADAFPDQALILAARLPRDDAESVFVAWYRAGEPVDPRDGGRDAAVKRMLARVAAMYLTRNHPEDVAASLLADSEGWIAVSVPDAGYAGTQRCVVGCEAEPDCRLETSDGAAKGWPPVFHYTMLEKSWLFKKVARAGTETRFIEAGGDTISYRRLVTGNDLVDCAPPPLNAGYRHGLLAEMLDLDFSQMPWSVLMNLTLPWSSDAQFLREMGLRVASTEAAMLRTRAALFKNGLITKSESELIRPRLAVVVFDDRRPAQPANMTLPQFKAKDSRTSYWISKWR
jgi:hypothetical protein